jgi:hypothetical protein
MVVVHVVFHSYGNLYFLYYIIFNEHKDALSKTSPLSLDVLSQTMVVTWQGILLFVAVTIEYLLSILLSPRGLV